MDELPRAPSPRIVTVDWRRNLAALWLAEFTAILGFSFAFPFLPLFLHRELHIASGSQLAFWTGISAGITGFALALTSPIWGRLADRYGRKPMLVRAMIGGGISVGLMGLAQSALQLTILRGVQGASSGTVAAATALVATETPAAHLAWALGILNSAISLGSAAGPAAGGLAANVVGLRAIFLGGGVMLLLATVPVLLVVREGPRRLLRAATPPTMQVLRSARGGTVKALIVLMVAESLQQTSYAAAQQLVVLRLLQLSPGAAQSLTGLTFAAAGIATALAAVTYSRVLRRSNYRTLTTVAAALTGLTLLATAAAGTPALLITTFVISSFVSGSLIPAFGAMIGLETPPIIQATIFGVSSSAVAVGFGFGPLIGGFVASATSVQAALVVAGIIALAMALLLGFGAREPRTAHGPRPVHEPQPAHASTDGLPQVADTKTNRMNRWLVRVYASTQARPPKWSVRAVGAVQRLVIVGSRGRLGAGVAGRPVLLLTTTGRRTGKPRTQPLLFLREGDCYLVAASFSGHDDDPAWLKNLKVNPNATVTIAGRATSVLAIVVAPSERARLWPRFPALFPAYARYQRATTREIPVVRLCPRT